MEIVHFNFNCKTNQLQYEFLLQLGRVLRSRRDRRTRAWKKDHARMLYLGWLFFFSLLFICIFIFILILILILILIFVFCKKDKAKHKTHKITKMTRNPRWNLKLEIQNKLVLCALVLG